MYVSVMVESWRKNGSPPDIKTFLTQQHQVFLSVKSVFAQCNTERLYFGRPFPSSIHQRGITVFSAKVRCLASSYIFSLSSSSLGKAAQSIFFAGLLKGCVYRRGITQVFPSFPNGHKTHRRFSRLGGDLQQVFFPFRLRFAFAVHGFPKAAKQAKRILLQTLRAHPQKQRAPVTIPLQGKKYPY